MRRFILFLSLVFVLAAAAACGSGDKPSAPAGDDAEAPASTATAVPDEADEPDDSDDAATDDDADDTEALGGLFSTLFGGALSGPDLFSGQGAELGQGDPALLDYVLKPEDLPGGFTPFGEFTFRMPDGISEGGGMDMAASMAYAGDIQSEEIPADGGFLMSMVIRPDDLTALGDMFESAGELSEEELREQLLQGAGELEAFGFQDFELLDTSGLGEGAFGMGLTMDLSALADAFGELADPSQAEELEDIPVITMRMYMFGRGDYAGAVMHMGFGAEGLDGADTLALAKLLDEKLQSAP